MNEKTRGEVVILVRADSFDKAMVALADVVRYGMLRIVGKPRILPPALSSWVLEDVTGEKPLKEFRAHVVARVEGGTGRVIGRVREIHPPAHILVVPPDTKAWRELLREWRSFKELKGFHPPKKTKAEEARDWGRRKDGRKER
ncbi:MAG: DUF356 domain-containing protein [Thermococci archaeon]|nr:DUF356 domain-containing protein [Thermococci archaeon]